MLFRFQILHQREKAVSGLILVVELFHYWIMEIILKITRRALIGISAAWNHQK